MSLKIIFSSLGTIDVLARSAQDVMGVQTVKQTLIFRGCNLRLQATSSTLQHLGPGWYVLGIEWLFRAGSQEGCNDQRTTQFPNSC